MPMIDFHLSFDEARELGLRMSMMYGHNIPKQYILLTSVAEVLHMIHLAACGDDVVERAKVERARADCDVAAIQFAQAIFQDIQGVGDGFS